jgi:DNA end-binding protein Ku
MAPRPLWKGFLKLALVACPVALYPAFSATARVSFNTLNRATGNRLRRQMVDEQTGDVVEYENQVRGYPVAKDEYVLVEDEDLQAVQLESTHTIDIEGFAPRDQVDEIYLDAPYYLVSDDRVGAEAFAVIRDAMARKKVVGLAKVVLFRRERLLMLEPRNKGMLATSLHYDYEIREDSDYLDSVALAEHIIDSKRGKFDPSKFKDRYEEAVVELIKARQAGKTVKAASRPRTQGNVVDLMEALRRSLKGEGAARETRGRTSAKPAKRKSASKSAGSKRRRAG